MRKIVLSISLAIFLIFSFERKDILALEEFKTFLKANYLFFENGNTAVTQEISLINQRPDIYITEYTLKITGEKVGNIKAWDNQGPLKVNSGFLNNTTTISLKFNEKIVGKDQTLSFIVKYEIPKLAKKEGRVWKVLLPKLDLGSMPNDYSLEVRVPPAFGSLAFASPFPNRIKKEADFSSFVFDKESILNTGILLEFGDYQVFDFTLIYQLQNTKDERDVEEISLPPDTSYQIVEYSDINPPPEDVTKDVDGNWLAKYTLSSNSRLQVRATGKAKIFPIPSNLNIVQNTPPEKKLEEKIYWEKDNQKIKEIAKNLKTAKEIYNFVVTTLNYNYEGAGMTKTRLGALKALDSPSKALCLEFTDLFVTLARASGIPAREIEGFAYTDNPKLRPLSLIQDILHAWPEYYDFQTSSWRMVDPTWGKTTGGFDYFNNFDMSHFAFVIHGADSRYPYPPGTYKFLGEETKNIFVNYGEDFLPGKRDFQINLTLSQPHIFKNEVLSLLTIRNSGPSAIYNFPIKITSTGTLKPNINEVTVPYLLPYGRISFPINFEFPRSVFFKNLESTILVKVADQEKQQRVNIKFFSEGLLKNLGKILLVVILIFFFIRSVRSSCAKLNL